MFYIKGNFYIKGCDKACPQLSLLSTIFVFRADPSSEMAALASSLLEHFYSAINGWILMKLDRKQFMNVCYHVCDFCADLSLKVTALFFDFLNHLCNCWTNLTKLNGEQVLNVVYQDCVFRPDMWTEIPPWPLIGWSTQFFDQLFSTSIQWYVAISCYFTSRSVIFQLYSDGTQTPSFRILTCIQTLMPLAGIAVIYVSSPPCTSTLTREDVFNL